MLEFLLVFPVVVIVTLASFEFAFLALVQQAATAAVIEGTREGALRYPPTFQFDNNSPLDTDPHGNDDVADRAALAAEQVLAVHCLEVKPGGAVHVVIERRFVNGVVQVAHRGDVAVACVPPAAPALRRNQFRVTVCFPLVDADDPSGCGGPVPDWLAPYGFSLAGYHMQVSAVADLE